MKRLIIPIISSAIILISSYCPADISIEQDCHVVTKTKVMLTSWNETAFEYQRRIFIKDDFLAVQLVANGVVTKEYGFDFKSEIYYESDLINNDYRKFLFGRINEEYAKIKMRDLRAGSGTGKAKTMFGNAGPANYKIRSGRSLFGRKKIGTLDCVLYSIKIGPGFSPFKSLSWGRDVKAWVTKDIPDYDMYNSVARQLKEEGGFYLAKSNEISDFIITLMYLDGCPIETSESIKQDFGVGRAVQNNRTSLYRIDTKPIADDTLSYFRDRDAFILNADEMTSDGTASYLNIPFAGSETMARGKRIYPHTARGKFFIILIVGSILVIAGIYLKREKNRKQAINSPYVKLCPHCKAVIDKLYIICPKCNKKISDGS